MIKVTEKQALLVHSMMIELTGGTYGVRDSGLFNSALNAPFQTFDGNEIYPSLLFKAAVMCYSIIANHPFIDGNKRTGIHIMLIFLELNGIKPKYTQKEIIELGLGAASGKMKSEDIFKWLIDRTD